MLGLLSLSGLVSLASLDRWSLTFDEITYTPAGVDYLRTGRIRFNLEKGPLAKSLSALPVLLTGAEPPRVRDAGLGFAAGWDFYFRNTVPARRIVRLSRIPSVAAGLALLLVVFLWARRLFDERSALLAAAFLALDPTFRALSRLAIPDIFCAAFFTAALWALDRALTRRCLRDWSLAGLLGAAAVLSKFSGLLFFPAAAVLILARKRRGRPPWEGIALLIGAATLAVLAVYRQELPRLLEGLAQQRQAMQGGPPLTFFLGDLDSGPRPYYYLASFLIKTPYPFLIACGAGLSAWLRRRDRGGLLYVAVPSLLFFVVTAAGRYYANRYLFPVTALLALLTAAGFARLPKRWRPALLALLAWQAAETVATYPRHLAYMNLPWRLAGHRVLANSDFDWGQSLPALARFWEREGRPALNLCYFGTAEPASWGVFAQEIPTTSLPSSRRVLPLSPEKEFLAVGAGCRQFMTLSTPDGRRIRAFDWLKDLRPIAVLAGGTMHVYDIRLNAAAHGRLGQIHLHQGEYGKALREAKRVLEIDPKSELGERFLKEVQRRASHSPKN